MADLICEVCGAKCEERYSFRYPNSSNQDTTKYICKECHEGVRVIINQFMNTVTVNTSKTEDFYPVVYPNTLNKETISYISYSDYKNLEKEINTFIENGGS